MSEAAWLPTWFHPPTWSGLSTGHHVRPARPSDDQPGGAGPAPRSGVRYVVLDDEERQVLGWIDLCPSPGAGGDAVHDAVVTWDVAAHLVGSAVEAALVDEVSDWVRRDWPFTAPRCERLARRGAPPRRG